ncbi:MULTISPECIES: hypothetical protein [Paenibacillus]|uniref:Uncharacterized protein n=1 Tax=Paenibacillus oceani TaxID=2772510 RepID=A0A927CCB0_9BACL|nr:hypothetical protein [Paenibacillus oceani]MBD2865020.1 hypothetical protein [Paenibacillus oceani]MDF2660091.1 hypothetical protein [Paenibacillus sp.]
MNQPEMAQLTAELEQLISRAGMDGLLQRFQTMSREELVHFMDALGTVKRYMLEKSCA